MTQAPLSRFVPPPPYHNPSSPGFAYGSAKLWVVLGGGVWHVPRSRFPYTEKIQWWRKGYNWRTEYRTANDGSGSAPLRITVKRLDRRGRAGLFGAEPAGMRLPSMMSGIEIPAPGCYEITGDYKGDKLSFVVKVEANEERAAR